jgi:hypothetical protein
LQWHFRAVSPERGPIVETSLANPVILATPTDSRHENRAASENGFAAYVGR